MTDKDDGSFYADGNRVMRSPLAKKNDDGTRSISLGFMVCEVPDHVSGGTEHIAAALNATNASAVRGERVGRVTVQISYATAAEADVALSLVTP